MGRITPPARLSREAHEWSLDLARSGIVAIVDATATNGVAALDQLATWRTEGVVVQRLSAMSSVDVTTAPAPVSHAGHKLMPPFGDLRSTLLDSWSRDVAVAVHCVELAELAELMEAVESIPRAARGELRIEHASECPPEWVARIGRLRPTIVTHPAFVAAHGDRYLADPDLVTPSWLYRLRSWIDADVPLVIASDAPAGPTAPLVQIRAAVTRTTARGSVVGPAEAISVDEAVRAATLSASKTVGLWEKGYGRLAVGTPANLVLVADGPAGISDPGAEVVASVIDGHLLR